MTPNIEKGLNTFLPVTSSSVQILQVIMVVFRCCSPADRDLRTLIVEQPPFYVVAPRVTAELQTLISVQLCHHSSPQRHPLVQGAFRNQNS